MPNTVTTTKIHDGARNAVYEIRILGDGTGEETATKLVDAVALGSEVKILDIQANLVGCSAQLLWDATTNIHATDVTDGWTYRDWHSTGGLVNQGGAGKTGDILITTTGLGSGDKVSATIRLRKRG